MGDFRIRFYKIVGNRGREGVCLGMYVYVCVYVYVCLCVDIYIYKEIGIEDTVNFLVGVFKEIFNFFVVFMFLE